MCLSLKASRHHFVQKIKVFWPISAAVFIFPLKRWFVPLLPFHLLFLRESASPKATGDGVFFLRPENYRCLHFPANKEEGCKTIETWVFEPLDPTRRKKKRRKRKGNSFLTFTTRVSLPLNKRKCLQNPLGFQGVRTHPRPLQNILYFQENIWGFMFMFKSLFF